MVGLHLVSMVIWVLKLLPLLPMEGGWYLVSAVLRNRCSIHRRHFRRTSDCTCTATTEGRGPTEKEGFYGKLCCCCSIHCFVLCLFYSTFRLCKVWGGEGWGRGGRVCCLLMIRTRLMTHSAMFRTW